MFNQLIPPGDTDPKGLFSGSVSNVTSCIKAWFASDGGVYKGGGAFKGFSWGGDLQSRTWLTGSIMTAHCSVSMSPPSQFSGLQAALPPAVHLLTMSQWDQDSMLLRLEHQFEAKESETHSQPLTVNLQVGVWAGVRALPGKLDIPHAV